MSFLPPLGHFNFARIGHYYFALTEPGSQLDKQFKLSYNLAASGCSAARLARAVRVGEVVGSNPTIPTKKPLVIPAVFLLINLSP
jgi:hypothetical protein